MFHYSRCIAASLLLTGSQLGAAQSYFAGTVVDGTNQPIAGATVQAGQMTGFQTPFQIQGQATTDAQGHYAITTLASGDGSGKYVLIARAPGRVATVYPSKPCNNYFPCPSSVPYPPTVTAPNPAVDFKLLHAASISGNVNRTDLNGPAAGITVFLDSSYLYPVTLTAVTDTKGDFRFDGLFPEHYQLEARASAVPNLGLLPQMYAAHDYDMLTPQPPGDDVVLSDGQDATGIDFALHGGAIIYGSVSSAFSGHAVSVPIGIRRLTPAPSGAGFTSAGQSGRFAPLQSNAPAPGWYSIGPLLPGTYDVRFGGGPFSIEYYQHALTEAQATPVTVGGSGQGAINIDGTVGSYQIIAGHITDASTGNPVVNAIVHGGSLLPGLPLMQDLTDALTDSSGAYALEGLNPGETYVWVTRNSEYLDQMYPNELGCCFPTAGSQAVQLAQGQYVPGIDMALTRGAVLEGHVYDPDTGAEAANLSVSLVPVSGGMSGSATTDSGGSFFSSTVPTGSYYVYVSTQQGYYYYPDYFCPFTASCDLHNAQALTFSAPQRYWLDFPIAHLDRVFQGGFE